AGMYYAWATPMISIGSNRHWLFFGRPSIAQPSLFLLVTSATPPRISTTPPQRTASHQARREFVWQSPATHGPTSRSCSDPREGAGGVGRAGGGGPRRWAGVHDRYSRQTAGVPDRESCQAARVAAAGVGQDVLLLPRRSKRHSRSRCFG